MPALTFLFASTPITAHTINPLPIAARLVERGHRVLWYAASRFHSRIAAVGAEPYGFTAATEFDDLAAAYGGAGSPRAIAGLRQGFAAHLVGDVVARVSDLEAITASVRVDAVLADAMFVAGRAWHERGGPVWATLGDGPLTYADVDTPPYGPGMLPMPGREGRRRNRVTARMARRLIWGPASVRLAAARAELGLTVVERSVFDEARSPYLHLQACVPEFEYPRSSLPAPIHFVGALRPSPSSRSTGLPHSARQPGSTDGDLPDWWCDLLADDRPAVLVSQGTLRPDLAELVLPALRGLAGAGVQVVVATGAGDPGRLPRALGGSVPVWVRTARWVPYDLVLPHVDAFVTNGGYTGVTLALAHGVPLVQVGSSEEKAEIGARIAWSGTGVRLRWRASPASLRSAVRQVLTDPCIRTQSDRVQRSMAQHDAATESADLLERLARTQAVVPRA